MPEKSKDFDASALLKTSENHEHQLKELSDRISCLENRVGNNESFAKSFADSVKSQTVASNALANNFNDLISTNNDTRSALREFVRSDHVHNVLSFMKSFGGALFWAIVGALVTHFVPKLFGGS